MVSNIPADRRRELSLRPSRSDKVLFLGTVLVLLALPLGLNARWQTIGVYALIAAIAALGLHVVSGLAGQISLGHAAFLGIGAYTACFLGVDLQLPVWVWLPGSGIAAGLAGAIVGPVAARVRGLYLAVATLALVFITHYVWEIWTGASGGVNGRSAPAVTVGGEDILRGVIVGGYELTGEQVWWYLALAFLGVSLLVTLNLQRTRMGRCFVAVRERDLAAAVAGIPVVRTKVIAFALSSAYAGVAGGLLASFQSYVVPNQWDLMLSVEYIAMVVIGGLGSAWGAVAGAFFVTAMPQLVTALSGWIPAIKATSSTQGGLSAPLLSEFLYGFAIILVLLFEPDGLHALWLKVKGVFARRRGSSSGKPHAPAADALDDGAVAGSPVPDSTVV